jgi:zinc finger protein 830
MEHLEARLEHRKPYVNSQISTNNPLMADVRTLLRNERNARRISHRHAKYSETGKLQCVVCHCELKNESLWNDHLRSENHLVLLKRNGHESGSPAGSPEPEPAQTKNGDEEKAKAATPAEKEPAPKQTKKRKASDDDDEEEQADTSRKRSKNAPLPGFLPQGFFDDATKAESEAAPSNGQEFRLPSRPATPLKGPDAVPEAAKPPTVDEDEWAAFEADIAAAEVAAEATDDAVISAAPMTTEEVAAQSREEEMSARKEKAEADLEGDKEDAVRKLEDEFEQMNELEERVRRLKEKREALRVKEPVAVAPEPAEGGKTEASNATPEEEDEDEDEDEDDDGEDDDDWAGFRLRG